jgi:CheY-like chemotaxis protein
VVGEVTQADELLELNILVAEDNHTNQIVISRLLKKMGCTVTLANDGQEAVSALAENDFDLVLMDCMMPGMDGYEATRAIRIDEAGRNSEAIPIIALTANALEGDRENCLACGMSDYLTKPINKVALRAALVRWKTGGRMSHDHEHNKQ